MKENEIEMNNLNQELQKTNEELVTRKEDTLKELEEKNIFMKKEVIIFLFINIYIYISLNFMNLKWKK